MVARVVLSLFVSLMIGGCASRSPEWRAGWTTAAPDLVQCLDLYERVDDAVKAAGVGDAQWARIEGFPYLRVSRFLASFRGEVDGQAFESWVDRLRALDRQARAIEVANLPDDSVQALGEVPGRVLSQLDDCAARLVARDLATVAGRRALRDAARPSDHYRDWQRVIGLYPLTAIPIAWGSFAWRQARAEVFNARVSLDDVTFYTPPGDPLDAPAVASILDRSVNSPLGIPEPAPGDLDALFESFAPVIAVDQKSGADQIGMIRWQGEKSVVDPDAPVAYRLVSHARVSGQVLLQLNYVFWFPARPRSGWLDLLAGHLDGLVWRVTLAPDGRPLIYESMHPCGCYHQFYPARPMVRTDRWSIWNEGAATPGGGPVPGTGERLIVHLEARTHYVRGLDLYRGRDQALSAVRRYTLRSYDALRRLPLEGGGTRSLFSPSGIVRGTARAERFLFWPMGIASAGAMRQWGTHATAFVGKRHFDDPFLIDQSYRVELP